MAEVDPQEFGEVKSNVTNIVTSLDRIDRKIDALATKEALDNGMRQVNAELKRVDARVSGVDARLEAVEDTLMLERASFWARIKTNMTSNIATIVAWALVLGLGAMVVSYFVNNYQPKEVIEVKEGK